MGLFSSGSTCSCNCGCKEKDHDTTIRKIQDPKIAEPTRFQVLDTKEFTGGYQYLAARIRYPNCTNYEGVKILVYYNLTEKDLWAQLKLDPHFCDNGSCISPIARFEPTDEGWYMAISFCRMLIKDNITKGESHAKVRSRQDDNGKKPPISRERNPI